MKRHKDLKLNNYKGMLFVTAFLLCIFLFPNRGWGQQTVERTATTQAGSDYIWSIPAGVTQVTIECVGGGGASGYADPRYQGTGGGGGGAYARLNSYSIPSTVTSLSIHVGGWGTSRQNDGTAAVHGGDSYVSVGGSQIVFAQGGRSVTGISNATGAAGGDSTSCIGHVRNSGGRGGNADNSYTIAFRSAGGGGGAAGATGDGGAGGNGGKGSGGAGGTGNSPGGNGGAGVDNAGVGGSPGGYGGGGGGTKSGENGFGGGTWHTGANGAGGYVRITYTLTTVNVTFNANMPQNDNNMNAAIPANTTIQYGEAFGSKLNWRDEAAKTNRRGYTFDGWNTAANGSGTNVNSSTTSTFTSDVTLFVKWKPKESTLTFNKNNGNWGGATPGSYTVKYGTTYGDQVSWDWATPTRTGYIFMGWNTKADGTGMFYGPTSLVTELANHTLYAYWVAEDELPTSMTLCYNEARQLCGPSGFTGYVWTPSQGLSSSTGQCVTLTASQMSSNNVTYKCQYAFGQIVNGDFSQGNVGFSSSYDIMEDDPSENKELNPERKVSATDCWGHVHSGLDLECTLESFENDKASGGKFLAVNGGADPEGVIWEQTVTVSHNTNYKVSLQCATASPSGDSHPACLLFFINGTQVSTAAKVVETHAWSEMSATWNSGSNNFATIVVKDTTTAASGNDFAIDHIVFEALDGTNEYNVAITRRPNFTAGEISSTGQSRNYGSGSNSAIGSTTAASGGDGSISYQWKKNGTVISGATAETYTPTETAVGTYTFTRWAKDNTCNTSWTQSSGSWTLTISASPVSFSILAHEYAVCNGSNVLIQLKETLPSGYDYVVYKDAACTQLSTPANPHYFTKTNSSTEIAYVKQTIAGTPAGTAQTVNVSCTPYCGQTVDNITCDGVVLYKEDFGGNNATDPGFSSAPFGAYTELTFHAGQDVSSGQYGLIKHNNNYSYAIPFNSDHTYPNDTSRGYMMTIDPVAGMNNAAMYESSISNLCSGSELSFTFWAADMHYNKGEHIAHPIFDIQLINPANDEVLLQSCMWTPDRSMDPDTRNLVWNQYGFNYTVPSGLSTLKFRLSNRNDEYTGNDYAIDDIQVMYCGGKITQSNLDTTICNGVSTTMSNTVNLLTTSGISNPAYKWQYSTDGNSWNDISEATGASYSTSTVGYYRMYVADAGVIAGVPANSACALKTVNNYHITARPAFTAGAIASTGQTICAGETANNIGSTTAASGGDGNISYQWYVGTTAISGATSATYTPTAYASTVGTHVFTRKAKDGTCNTTLTASTNTWTLTVNAAPSVTVTTPTGCPNQSSYTLTANVSGGSTPYTYVWSNGATGTASTSTISKYGTSDCGHSYSYTVTVTGANGCSATETSSFTLNDNTAPVIGTIADQDGIASTNCKYKIPDLSTVTLAATTEGCGTPTFVSQSVAANTEYDQTAVQQSIPVTVKVKDDCDNEQTATVNVIIPSKASVALSNIGDTSICSGSSTTLTATPSSSEGTVTYSWNTGSTDNPYTVTPTTTTTYTVTATATKGSCSATDSKSVTVTVLPAFTAGEISSTGETIALDGTPSTIGSTTAASGGDGNISYQWYEGTNAISGATSATYTPAASYATSAGTYTFTRKAKDNVCQTSFATSTGSYVLTVNNPMSISVTSYGSRCYNQADGFITVNVTGGTPNYTLTWTGGSHTMTSEGSYTINNLADGSYTISVTDANSVTESCATPVVIAQITDTLKITADDDSYTYDGSTHSKNSFQIKFGSETKTGTSGVGVTMSNGDVVTVTITGSITAVTESPATNTVGSVTITRGGDDISCYYNVKKTNGKLTMSKSHSVIALNVPTTTSKKYDGTALNPSASATGIGSDVITLEYSTNGGVTWTTVAPSITHVSEGPKTVNVRATNPNYDTVQNTYTLTIAQRNVKLTSGSSSKAYDGTPLTNNSVTPTGDGFVGSEGFTPSATGSQTEIGTSPNEFTYLLTGGAVATDYSIIMTKGVLVVTDGEPGLTNDGHVATCATVASADGESFITRSGVRTNHVALAKSGKRLYGTDCSGSSSTIDTITFIANGGSGTMDTMFVTRGTATAISTLGYSHTNWSFTGWNDACDGTGTNYADGDNITTNGNVKLYANWHTWCTGTPRASNEVGTARIDSVEDHDHNWYKVVQIGDQCWLKENMRCTTSPKGNLTAGGSDESEFLAYYYDYSAATQFSLRERGYLYNWAGALDTNGTGYFTESLPGRQGICPQGWHIPTFDEWDTLDSCFLTETDGTTPITEATLSNDDYRGKGVGMFTSSCAWNSSRNSGTFPNNYSYADRNATGFSAVPAGYHDVSFLDAGIYASFWSATTKISGSRDASNRDLYNNNEGVARHNSSRSFGYSVRCLRNNTGLTLGAVNKTDSTTTTLTISAAYTATQTVTGATVCAYADAGCTTPAGTCDTVVPTSSPITGTITGLSANTQYYVKVIATTAGGSESAVAGTFRTVADGLPCPNAATVTDVDSNTYNTVLIGTQCWMKENLKTTKYADGTSISQGSATSTTTPYWYYPNNSTSNKDTYGLLYNWIAVMHNSSSSASNPSNVQGICPTGWHVPSNAEWTQLTNYVSSQTSYCCSGDTRNIAKVLASTTGWTSYTNTCTVGNSPSDNNATGFGAMPAGYYRGNYRKFGTDTYIWSATKDGSSPYTRSLSNNDTRMGGISLSTEYGLSVRCLRDVSGITLGAVTKTDSTATTLTISADYSGDSTVTGATVCAYTDTACTTPAGTCDTVVPTSSPITGTITGLSANTQYYVKVTATTAGGSESAVAGPFGTAQIVDTITFIPNGGAGTMTKQTVPRGTTTAINTLEYSHTNWSFIGWNDASDGNGTSYANGDNITTNGNVKLYANWHTWCTGAPKTNEQGTARIDSVEDHDHNWYKVVQIGDQCWLKENMRCTTSPKGNLTYRSGAITSEYNAYYYNYSAATQFSLRERGYLYNWAGALDTNGTSYITASLTNRQGICPQGWHVPSDVEWVNMAQAVAPTATDINTTSGFGYKAASTDIAASLSGGYGWSGDGGTGNTPNSYSNPNRSSSGFSALPVGLSVTDHFIKASETAIFWSATSADGTYAYGWGCYYSSAGFQYSKNYKYYGFPVRCLRNNTGLTMGAVNKTDSTTTTLTISAAYTASQTVTGATVCAYTDPACTTPAGSCASGVPTSSPITGTITGLSANTQYYVKVIATTAGGSESAVAGPFGTKAIIDTITFIANGGLGTMTKQTVTRGAATAINTLEYSHTNWSFTGWNDACDGNGTSYADGANITTNGNVTLYANWHSWCTGTPKTNEQGTARIDSVEDHDHNWYKVVQIGTQCWLKENMRCETSPSTGSTILMTMVSSLSSKSANYYNNDKVTYGKYGVLYNWCAALDTFYVDGGKPELANDPSHSSSIWNCTMPSGNRRGICPKGWHIPTDEEWKTLESDYLTENDGTRITAATLDILTYRGKGAGKFTSGCDWNGTGNTTSPNSYLYADRNTSGFSAIPAGYYNGSFVNVGNGINLWTATVPSVTGTCGRYFSYNEESVFRYTDYNRFYGRSVRCVRD